MGGIEGSIGGYVRLAGFVLEGVWSCALEDWCVKVIYELEVVVGLLDFIVWLTDCVLFVVPYVFLAFYLFYYFVHVMVQFL